jgi:predicted DNA-binding transcriptional regulator YafY
MKKNQKALIRHNLIYQKLNQGQIVNIAELAKEFGVGIRTIQKDLNERLSSIYDIEDLGQGNYIFPKHHRFVGGKDEEESIAISLMKELQHSAIPEMDTYIESALPTSSNYDEIFVFGLNFEAIEDIEAFNILIKAIKWKVGVEFVYTKIDGSSKKVFVDPYRLANFPTYWYLIAYDPSVEILKTYYFKNISELTMLYENFTGNAQIEEDLNKVCNKMDSVWYSGEQESCLLRVEDKAKYYLERDVPANMEIVEQYEDYTIVRMIYHNEIELFSFVKQWIPNVKIIDNPVLSDKLSTQLQDFLSAT